jgi:hypothetical protein
MSLHSFPTDTVWLTWPTRSQGSHNRGTFLQRFLIIAVPIVHNYSPKRSLIRTPSARSKFAIIQSSKSPKIQVQSPLILVQSPLILVQSPTRLEQFPYRPVQSPVSPVRSPWSLVQLPQSPETIPRRSDLLPYKPEVSPIKR